MSLHQPTRNFQIYQIFATNTNIGKTIFSAGLCRATTSKYYIKKRNNKVFYLKPVQTGFPLDNDERFVSMFNDGKNFEGKNLFKYEMAVSPHLACDKVILFSFSFF